MSSPYQQQPRHQPGTYPPQPPYQHGQPGPYQRYGQPRPGPPPHGGGRPPGPGARSRSRAGWLVVGVLLTLLAGAGGTVYLLGGDDGDGETEVALTPHPELAQLPFPDPAGLDYGDGPDALCAAVSEVMAARNYLFTRSEENDGGVDCWYTTPGASLVTEGAFKFDANVFVAQGYAAEDAYERFRSAVVAQREHSAGNESLVWSPLYAFPVGEEGWITHQADTGIPRGDGTAAFRSGDATYYLMVNGWVQAADRQPGEAAGEDVIVGEISDIVTGLAGEGTPGEPRLSASAAQEYPGLPELGSPTLSSEPGDRCSAVTAALTGARLVRREGTDEPVDPADLVPTYGCRYGPSDAAYDASAGTDVYVEVSVTVEHYGNPENTVMFAGDELGSELLNGLEQPGAVLYDLPAGSQGFLIPHGDEGASATSGTVLAGWVVGDDLVTSRVSGFHAEGFDRAPIPEETLVETLLLVIGAMAG
ncbi:hypothetical protein RM844_09870 [Streptomyces sp. DSM 44915]|uniref:Uncharacterized protein n=1 Tax=Streptomyces chisholmiae TaxID=3075540 RepID=A0ABU2JNP2_9ACTN|nr:hypothetical protein [Streptomyces sp. DSM 44915]MDT0266600.1 hypothetical protein [Streptomyces sp. DSM 44915]